NSGSPQAPPTSVGSPSYVGIDPSRCQDRTVGFPIPRQQLADPLCRMVRQSGEHVGKPSAWVDVVELGGLDQRVDGGGPPPTFIRSREGPVVAANRDTAQCPLGGIIGHAQPAVIEEAYETAPAIEAIGDGFGNLVAG